MGSRFKPRRDRGGGETGGRPGWACALALCAALAVSGCETAPDGTATVDPSLVASTDPVPPASNELDRLGRQDLDLGNSGLAEDHFRQAVEKNADDAFAWIGLAAAYDDLKRFDLADRAYAQAIRLQGETLPIINNLGYSYYLRGDRARALAKLRRAALLYPNSPVIENNIHLVQSGELPNRRAAP